MKLHYAKAVIREIQRARRDLQTVKLCDDVLELHDELVRLRGEVKKAHHEGCCDGLEMCCHSDAWDESEAKRAITIPEGE